MKNGKSIALLTCLVAIASTVLIMRNNKKTKKRPTTSQYENRLDEFCLFDAQEAKEEFHSFLELGFNPADAFELTIVKRVYI